MRFRWSKDCEERAILQESPDVSKHAPLAQAHNTMTAHAQLARARSLSRFLDRLLTARPALVDELLAGLEAPFSQAQMRERLALDTENEDQVKARLRDLRSRVMAHLIVRDLAGWAPLEEVTETMTVLAEVALEHAVHAARATLVARHGEPRDVGGMVQDFMVIGMGKLGGRELNVSSDIDLIFVYPEDGATSGPRVIDNFDFFTRLGRSVIGLLNELTADGQVFRVDMRLRPNGDSGPLVCSLDMLENYFITQGREWERYAWIKARLLVGGHEDALEALRRPFVFRKYLDFGAISALRELHAQIRREVARRDKADDIKLGPGGIREIEFCAQAFQLIRGGREPSLQIKPTCQTLKLLADQGILAREAYEELLAAYDFLRRLEHRLQYLDDAQTHHLPRGDADQALIAQAMGFEHFAAMKAKLDGHRAAVSRHFAWVFGDPNRGGHTLSSLWAGLDDEDSTLERLRGLGFPDATMTRERLLATQRSARYQQLPAAIRTRFDSLMPRLIESCAKTPAPHDTLARTLDLIEAISRRGAYLALLSQYPQALQRVIDLVAASRWTALYLTQHPLLLDDLLDERTLDTAPDWPAFAAALAQQMAAAEPDTERQMDLMREAHHSELFRLLTQDINGRLTVEKLADHLSALADCVLQATLTCCWQKLATRHRDAPRFCIVSYGKLGGKELGYASDLDLIFLYDDDAPNAQEIYSRLAQRINTWLGARTAAGILFETDLRLRPNGEAGLLVSSIEAFAQYQMQSAWVWEHQALTRARFSAGDTTLGAKFEQLRIDILCKQRELTALRDEVLAMRTRMHQAHPTPSGQFDLKHDHGGLIDVEFIVQYLVLGYAHLHPELTLNLGNIALLGRAGELGLITQEAAAGCADAYRALRKRQHALRLSDERHARVADEQLRDERAAVCALWRAVLCADEHDGAGRV
jgi:glutamate-ammonia-ligase adenylyltransferase